MAHNISGTTTTADGEIDGTTVGRERPPGRRWDHLQIAGGVTHAPLRSLYLSPAAVRRHRAPPDDWCSERQRTPTVIRPRL